MNEDSLLELLANAPRDERAALLDRHCGTDHALRARLEARLAAFEASGVDVTPPAPVDPTTAYHDGARPLPEPASRSGVALGGGVYHLLERIGEGGMGEVWMADQTEPVKRRVAVKLIKADRGPSTAILARFEAERQAIALMDHPNIARLLDAGTSPDGNPFFVMELIRGVPLTDYCDRHRLSVPARLKLFTQICGAVQHAHQKGVIHRDLKPTNVLIEDHAGTPVPKVIDFGLAKAADGVRLTERTLFTAFGAVLGTPLYMAPEQARFDAADVDTRADVYALGVILYELLTGTTPITRDTFKQVALDRVLQLIREHEPPTPSSRLSSGEATPGVAANRQTEPAKLGRFLRGDLDWVVLKALAKERDRRYDSPGSLAADVDRFLNHEPVAAGPPTIGYKLRKFVRRHRGPVTAAVLVLLALVAGVVGTALGLVEALRQAEYARGQEKLAREEGEKARAEQQRAGTAEPDAVRQAGLARAEKGRAERERDVARRNVLTNHLTQAAAVGGRDPLAAVALLDSTEACPLDLPDFTWRLVRGRYDRVRGTFRGPVKTATSAACSPDGALVVTAGEDGAVLLWDVRTGRERVVAPPDANGPKRWVAWRPGTRQFAFTDGTRTRFWDADADKEAFALPAGGLGPPAFTPDGKTMAAPAARQLLLWDLEARKQLWAADAHGGGVTAVAFSPDGRGLLSGGSDATVRRWERDTGTGRELAKYDGPVWAVAWAAKGRLAAAAVGSQEYLGDGRGAVLFDPDTGAEKRTVRAGIVRGVWGVAFTPDGSSLVTGNGGSVPGSGNQVEGDVQFWDPDTGVERSALRKHAGSVQGFSFSADGTTVAVASGGALRYDGQFSPSAVTVWDVSARRESAKVDGAGGVVALAATPGGVCGVGRNGIVTWDLSARRETGRVPLPSRLAGGNVTLAAGLSADGRTLATAEDRDARSAVAVRDARTGKELLAFDTPPAEPRVTAVAVSPTGRTLAVARANGGVALLDVASGTEVRSFPAHARPAKAVAFSPDGRWLATRGGTANQRGEVVVWAADTGREVARLHGDRWDTGCVAFSPDGGVLASGDETGGVSLWTVPGGVRLASLSAGRHPVRALAFSPDGQTLVGGCGSPTSGRPDESGEVHFWDVLSTQRRAVLPTASPVTGVAFSPDGRSVAAAAGQLLVWDAPDPPLRGVLRAANRSIVGLAVGRGRVAAIGLRDVASVWDTTTGQQTALVVGDRSPESALALSPDGRLLATTTSDDARPVSTGEVQLRDADTGNIRHRLQGFRPGMIRAVAFSPDGGRIAAAEGVGAKESRVRVWDTRRAELTATLPASPTAVTALGYLPGTDRLFVGRIDGTLELWDPTGGVLLWALTAHKSPLEAVTVSPDGRRIFTGARDGTLKAWTTEGKPLLVVEAKRQVHSLAVTPDGELLMVASFTDPIQVFRTSDLAEVGMFPGHGRPVSRVAVTPDGKIVIGGDYDGNLRLWGAGQYTRTSTR